ncbi:MULTISPECIES: tripartite tricarboxylate transporter permease [unclassified Neorhizobium]|uniref:tripartite tricarboxylate transporter permease n=1 Tax=unclassified Neorhizobium TaxID=2629175 RepID=UPI001FF3C1F0|nr:MULTISPECIES: tripartite tricarboxylate transporter permease [unclassified Neorhizobium]MCJ9668489.1 tripartite tricarboxylate transporter permease [Neorhizobium sp. SHOUNA12B]MCJ9743980.1 tripartite tricarboxylate transporter permease [Neorhizobium sp. SHOUNA12A]
MDTLNALLLGFDQAILPTNLFWCLIGTLLGTLVGVLPGLGPAATMAILLPFTIGLEPVTSLIMMAGIYYGAQYGGSTTAILLNLPGEASSVVTAIDGYKMARNGRAGVALSTAAIGSFFAGTVATLLLALFAPSLAEIGLLFGPAEYFSLMILGLVASVVLSRGSLPKALAMVFIGILVGLVGQDVQTAVPRFTLGFEEMSSGINFVVVAMGLFGIGELIKDLENPESRTAINAPFFSMIPSREDWRRMVAPILRGTGIGSVLGLLPGGGALLAAFAAYAIEKRVANPPEGFGGGAIEGVASPESANNAGAQTSFVPLLTLGLPANAVMALMFGALIMQGIAPGPTLISEHPDVFWGVIVSMWVGNVMLLVLNLPLIGIWTRLLTMPFHYLFPAIVVFCSIGAFSLSNSVFDLWLLGAFGVAGYIFAKLDCDPAPLVMGLILGPMMEENFRRAMFLARGNHGIFVDRPISAGLLVLAVLAILAVALPKIKAVREEAFQE